MRAKIVALTSLLAVSVGVVPNTARSLEPHPQCVFTGGGRIGDPADSFGGRAFARKDGTIVGTWTHVTHDGRQLRGQVEELVCLRNGGDPGRPEVEFSLADFFGTGTFDGEPVQFGARGQDHGEPGTADRYNIVISDEAGQNIYFTGGILAGGDLQIIPPNPGHP